MAKSFRIVVEEDHSLDAEIPWDGDEVPDILILSDGSMLMKVGRYLAAGDSYRFRVPTVHSVASEPVTTVTQTRDDPRFRVVKITGKAT